MQRNFYKIPVEILLDNKIFDTKENQNRQNAELLKKTTSKENAIKENLNLLLLTRKGELFSNFDFGLEIWNHDFESKKLKYSDKKDIENDIINAINKYEKRLVCNSHQVDVQFVTKAKVVDNKHLLIHFLIISIKSVIKEKFKSRKNYFLYKLMIPIKVFYKM